MMNFNILKGLLKYNKKCQRIDKYLLSGTKKQKVVKLEIKKIEKLGKEKKEQYEFSPTMKN